MFFNQTTNCMFKYCISSRNTCCTKKRENIFSELKHLNLLFQKNIVVMILTSQLPRQSRSISGRWAFEKEFLRGPKSFLKSCQSFRESHIAFLFSILSFSSSYLSLHFGFVTLILVLADVMDVSCPDLRQFKHSELVSSTTTLNIR